MKYLAIFDRNVATIFHLKWKIGNIFDMFLEYSVLSHVGKYDRADDRPKLAMFLSSYTIIILYVLFKIWLRHCAVEVDE